MAYSAPRVKTHTLASKYDQLQLAALSSLELGALLQPTRRPRAVPNEII